MNEHKRLFLVEPNGSGGLIHFAYQLCTALADQGFDVTLVTGSDYELTHFPHNFRVENMLDLWTLFDPRVMHGSHSGRVGHIWGRVRWTIRRGLRGVRLIRAWARLTDYLLREKPDIVQFSKINFPFEAIFLSHLRRRGLRLTQICHEFELRESRGPLSSVAAGLYRNVYTHFSALFFLANESRERFLSLFPSILRERTRTIPHGNSEWLLNLSPAGPDLRVLQQRYQIPDGDKVILFFGLLAPSKGIEDLIDAFALIRGLGKSKLIIAGYPTKHFELDKIRLKISALGLADRVVLDTRYIPLEEVGPLMNLASVVVYPYRSSTQSGSLQVAYTFGRPVIATSVGGLPEVVEDGMSGFLVPAQSPQHLAEKINILIENPDLAIRMGEYARHLSETRFSWESIAAEIKRAYDQLLANN